MDCVVRFRISYTYGTPLLREYSKQSQTRLTFHRGFVVFSTIACRAFCTDSEQTSKYRIYFYRSYVQIAGWVALASQPGCMAVHKRYQPFLLVLSSHTEPNTQANPTTHSNIGTWSVCMYADTKYICICDLVSTRENASFWMLYGLTQGTSNAEEFA